MKKTKINRKEAYEQEYKLKCLVMSGYEYIKQKKWKRVNPLPFYLDFFSN